MLQGYTKTGHCYIEIQQHIPWSLDTFWETEGKSMHECLSNFLKAPIFNGKTFWEAENEIKWVDD